MALTQTDVNLIKDVLAPNFERIDKKFDQIDLHFEQIRQLFKKHDGEFRAIDDRFEEVLNDTGHTREDVAVIKEMVKDHSFRIARLEHRTRPAE